MDPMGIIAMIGAAGVFFQQIVNFRETKRRLDELEKAHEECLERDRQREMEVAELRTESKTVESFETLLASKSDSDRRFIKQQFENLTATYDVEKKRVTRIEKRNPGETLGGE